MAKATADEGLLEKMSSRGSVIQLMDPKASHHPRTFPGSHYQLGAAAVRPQRRDPALPAALRKS